MPHQSFVRTSDSLPRAHATKRGQQVVLFVPLHAGCFADAAHLFQCSAFLCHVPCAKTIKSKQVRGGGKGRTAASAALEKVKDDTEMGEQDARRVDCKRLHTKPN